MSAPPLTQQGSSTWSPSKQDQASNHTLSYYLMCSKWIKNLCWTQKIPTSMKIICLETGPKVYGGPPFLNSSSLDSHCCVCHIRPTPLIPSVVQFSSWKNFSWFLLKAIKWVSHWLTHVVKSYDQLVSQFLHFLYLNIWYIWKLSFI